MLTTFKCVLIERQITKRFRFSIPPINNVLSSHLLHRVDNNSFLSFTSKNIWNGKKFLKRLNVSVDHFEEEEKWNFLRIRSWKLIIQTNYFIQCSMKKNASTGICNRMYAIVFVHWMRKTKAIFAKFSHFWNVLTVAINQLQFNTKHIQ